MDKRKLRVSLLTGILALALVLGLAAGFMPATAQAVTSTELKNQLDNLKKQKSAIEAEISNLKNQIKENGTEIERMVSEKNVIDQEIFYLYRQIDNTNNQIATYSLMIADKQEELTAAEAKYDKLLQENKERIQAMEEEGEVSYWSVLFQANSFADLLDRVNMVREIAASDRRRLDELNEAAQVVATAKAELQEEKAALEETKEVLTETQAELEVKREEADVLLAELVDRGIEYELLVEMAHEEKDQLMLDIARKEDEYDDAIYREWLATSVPPTTKPKPPSQTEPTTKPTETTKPEETTEPGETTEPTEETKPEETEPEETKPATVSWMIPINYTAFTSPYGYRDHPVYGGVRFHYGVDLAAPQGTPIYASRSGTVTTASYDGSAGYYVQINHGDGFKSIYMHMTHFVVSAGQSVSQGQVIGYCGSTGASTGPHLHFGITKNGEYVNPAYYIPI